jgi:hypothetical protein
VHLKCGVHPESGTEKLVKFGHDGRHRHARAATNRHNLGSVDTPFFSPGCRTQLGGIVRHRNVS